jgi:hypothetical protein
VTQINKKGIERGGGTSGRMPKKEAISIWLSRDRFSFTFTVLRSALI